MDARIKSAHGGGRAALPRGRLAQPWHGEFQKAAELERRPCLRRVKQVDRQRREFMLLQDDLQPFVLDRLRDLIRQNLRDPDAGDGGIDGGFRRVDGEPCVKRRGAGWTRAF